MYFKHDWGVTKVSIKTGEIVSIRHYSGVNSFKSAILGYHEDKVTVKLTRDFSIINFFVGDPVVISLYVKEEVISIGCTISQFQNDKGIVELIIDSVERHPERRQYERYPVSIYADVKKELSRKKYLAIIKDINIYGLCFYSKEEFEVDNQLEISMYVEMNILFLNVVIVRKVKRENYFEYGAKIVYKDASTMNVMEEYLKKVQKIYENDIKKFKI